MVDATTSGVPNVRNRDEAVAFLDSRIGHGNKPGLSRIIGLLEFMGDPQNSYRSIHIAGTNGKTTVVRMVQQILGAHGLAAGGFTSPHLSRIEERFTLHGVTLDPLDFVDAVADIAWFVEAYEQRADTHVTYFEVTAALAFSIFATAAVDVAVVEVGLGGRLDATNVLTSSVSVITGIDIDHTEFLGTRIGEIATEKVAIVGRDGTLVTGPLPEQAIEAVTQHVESSNANWIKFGVDFAVEDAVVAVGGHQATIEGIFGRYEDLILRIHGRHQVDNLATSIATSELFIGQELDHHALALAVESITSPGRLEVVSRRPVVILDGAHNVQGFRGLAATLLDEFPALGWRLVLGIRGERDVEELVAPLNGLVSVVYATQAEDDAALDAADVAAKAGTALGVVAEVAPNVKEAIALAQQSAGSEGGVVVAGSLYLVGEAVAEFSSSRDRTSEAHVRFDAPRFDDTDDDGDEYVDRFDELDSIE